MRIACAASSAGGRPGSCTRPSPRRRSPSSRLSRPCRARRRPGTRAPASRRAAPERSRLSPPHPSGARKRSVAGIPKVPSGIRRGSRRPRGSPGPQPRRRSRRNEPSYPRASDEIRPRPLHPGARTYRCSDRNVARFTAAASAMSWTEIASNPFDCIRLRSAACSASRVRRIRGSRTSQSEIGITLNTPAGEKINKTTLVVS